MPDPRDYLDALRQLGNSSFDLEDYTPPDDAFLEFRRQGGIQDELRAGQMTPRVMSALAKMPKHLRGQLLARYGLSETSSPGGAFGPGLNLLGDYRGLSGETGVAPGSPASFIRGLEHISPAGQVLPGPYNPAVPEQEQTPAPVPRKPDPPWKRTLFPGTGIAVDFARGALAGVADVAGRFRADAPSSLAGQIGYASTGGGLRETLRSGSGLDQGMALLGMAPVVGSIGVGARGALPLGARAFAGALDRSIRVSPNTGFGHFSQRLQGAAPPNLARQAADALTNPLPSEQVLAQSFKDDAFMRLGQLPGVRQAISPFNPAARAGAPGALKMARDVAARLRAEGVPPEQFASAMGTALPKGALQDAVRQVGIVDAVLREQARGSREAALNMLRQFAAPFTKADIKDLGIAPQGLSERLPIRWDAANGLVKDIAIPQGKSPFLWDIIEHWDEYPDIVADPAKRQVIEAIDAISKRVIEMLAAEGIKVNVRDTLVHMPRMALAKELRDSAGKVINNSSDLLDSLADKSAMEAVLGEADNLTPDETRIRFAFQNALAKMRKYDTVEAGVKAGVEYSWDIEESMGRMVDQANRLIRTKRVTEMLAPLGRTNVVDESYHEAVKLASQRVRTWQKAVAGLESLRTGGRFPRGALKQLETLDLDTYNQVIQTEGVRRVLRGRLIDEIGWFGKRLAQRQEVLGKMALSSAKGAERLVKTTMAEAEDMAGDLTRVAEADLAGGLRDMIRASGIAEAQEQGAVLLALKTLQKNILNAVTLSERGAPRAFNLEGRAVYQTGVDDGLILTGLPVAKIRAFATDLRNLETRLAAGAFEDIRILRGEFADSLGRMTGDALHRHASDAREIAADLAAIDRQVVGAAFKDVKDVLAAYNRAISRGLADTRKEVLGVAKEIGKEQQDVNLKLELTDLSDKLKTGLQGAQKDLRAATSKRAAEKRKLSELAPGELRPTAGPMGVQGRFFPADIAKEINNKFGREASQWLAALDRPSGAVRTVGTGFDFGAPVIQGVTLLARGNYAIWANAAGRHLEAFVDPASLARYNTANSAAQAEMRTIGRLVPGASEYFTAVERGGLLTRIPIAGGLLRRFQQSFDAFQTIVQTELWKSMRPGMARRGLSGSDAGDAIRNIAGVGNASIIGKGPVQQQLERLFGAFAPRYTQAAMSTMADLARGGVRGSEARRTAGGLLMSGLGGYYFLGKAIGQEPQLDPTKPHWLEYLVGDDWVGVGGVWRRMLKTQAALLATGYNVARGNQDQFGNEVRDQVVSAEYWDPLDPEAWRNNPLLSGWQGQAPPFASLVTDAYFNRSYEGTFIEGLPQRFLPFTIGSQVGRDTPAPSLTPLQIAGLRVSPGETMPPVLRRFLADKGLDDTRASTFWRDPQKGGVSRAEQKAFLEDNPEVKAWLDNRAAETARSGRGKDRVLAESVRLRNVRLQGEREAAATLLSTGSAVDFDQEMRALRLRETLSVRALYDFIGGEKPEPDDEASGAHALWEYGQAHRAATSAGGIVDWDLLQAHMDLAESGWSLEQKRHVEEQVGQTYHETPEARLWQEAEDKKKALDWYRMYLQLPEMRDSGTKASYLDYLAAKRDGTLLDWAKRYPSPERARKVGRDFDDKVTALREKARMADPALDAALVLTQGGTPLTTQAAKRLMDRLPIERKALAILSGNDVPDQWQRIQAAGLTLEEIAASTPDRIAAALARVTPAGAGRTTAEVIAKRRWVEKARALLKEGAGGR